MKLRSVVVQPNLHQADDQHSVPQTNLDQHLLISLSRDQKSLPLNHMIQVPDA